MNPIYQTNSLQEKISILRDLKKQMGFTFPFLVIKRVIQLYYYKLFKNRKFSLNGEDYPYYYALYNGTFLKERAVEIPLVMKYVNDFKGKNILEIGNVLSHYIAFTHDIVDKYEKAEGVNNIDIIEYTPHIKYDLIISISTFEHIGWDEIPQEKGKILIALNKLKGMMNPGANAILTLPLGHNEYFDGILKNNLFEFDEKYFLKRITKDNQWIQVDYASLGEVKYNHPFQNANVLFIGIIKN